jgi:hypothetical protein
MNVVSIDRGRDRPRAMKPLVSMRDALSDPGLLGNVLVGESWLIWHILLIAFAGEALNRAERRLFTKLTGRATEPLQLVEMLVAVVGRRGGKSRAMAVLAAFIAGLCDHSGVLAPGERGVLLLIAPDQRQASILLNYIKAVFEQSPLLKQLVTNTTADALELTNGISIEVRSASFRRLRGPTYICVIADEAAFWYTEEFSSNSDREIIDAVRPGLATTGGPLIIVSSPYARRGVLWETYKEHFGPNGDALVLVAQGASRTFNPTLSEKLVARAYERDPISAAAEYGAEFRTDLESFVAREVVEAAIVPGRYELPPVRGVDYVAFLDPAGGSGSDAMTLGIAHRDRDGRAVLDVVRERRPPFSPEQTVKEFAELLANYGIRNVTGDHWGGEFVREPFRNAGIEYKLSEKTKNEIYRDALPLLNSGKVELLDHPRLVAQLCSLERRASRAGRDSIDHPPGQHDDICNSALAALLAASAPDDLAIWRACASPSELRKFA